MKKILFILSFLIFTFTSFSQNILKKTDSLLQTGNYTKAIVLLENIPNKTVLQINKLGSIYQQIGNYKNAILQYEKSLKQEKSVLIKEKLAKSYQNYGDLEKAIPLFNELLTKTPNNMLLKYYVAKLFYTKKMYDNASVLFDDLHKKDSLNSNFTYYLGRIFQETNKPIKAKQYYLKTVLLDSNFIKPYFRLVKIYHKNEQYDSTFYFLNKGLKIRPKYKSLNQIKAKIQFSYGEYKNVIKQVTRLDSLKINNAFYQQLQGMSYFYNKEYQKAQKTFQKILQNIKADEKTIYYLALSHKELKEYELAIMYLNLSINMQQPRLDKEFYNLGLIYKEIKNPKEAINAFKEATKTNKYHRNALYELAVLSENYYKDKKIALKLYQQYLDNFEENNKQQAAFVKQQLNKIKTKLFYNK